ncbi:hypothetical protein SUDANB95_02611 [Actinosynnema sp. ALI-1.44]
MSEDEAVEVEKVQPPEDPAPVRVPPPLLGDPELIQEVVRESPPPEGTKR